jgi:hypothetical protein
VEGPYEQRLMNTLTRFPANGSQNPGGQPFMNTASKSLPKGIARNLCKRQQSVTFLKHLTTVDQ